MVNRQGVILEKNIKDFFEQFLKSKGVKLHSGQIKLAACILNQVVGANEAMLGRRTGKSFIFGLLDEFLSSLEIIDKTNVTLSYKDRHIPIQTSGAGAN